MRTSLQRADVKVTYWEAQANWWKRWAHDHGLSLDAANCASIHLSFMQKLATQAAHEQRHEKRESKTIAVLPPEAKKLSQNE
ncbi:hypothetical protein GN244_ATG17461 [Phytophthora infestans]|uniref:Uncharacterized protein n=1 Tax=Phytophthora infestans TaxID=4787 RepID=A0A833SSF9_PHYIN|nr:hypothetical protein GN244_ATG17461 [Phytophthora infestans]KAF4142607.1 hypothetical protein GN958_ATG08208 [Phytophthora infestans]